MQIEVRCCCTPSKLLGWIELETLDTPRVCFPVRNSVENIWPMFVPVVLEFTAWRENGREGHAFKADGIPLDMLKRIPCFTANEAAE